MRKAPENKRRMEMEKNRFGRMAEDYQKRNGLEKKVIYKGICSAATFTRVQTEERILDYLVLETLLARMGKTAEGFENLLRQEDSELWEKRLEIKSAAFDHDCPSVKKLLREYREKMPEGNKLQEQFCLYYEMKLAGWEEESGGMVCALAWQALQLTKQDGELPNEKDSLYTPMEMDLLLTLIRHRQEEVCFPDPEDSEKVIHPLDAWKEDCRVESALWDMTKYMETYYRNNGQKEVEGDVWLELLKLLEQSGRNDKLRFCIERALESFAGATGIRRLAKLHLIKARLIGRLKKAWDGSDGWVRLCKEELMMAYAVCEVMGMEKELAEIEDYCREELQWRIM